MYACAVGLDVHLANLAVCVIVQRGEGEPQAERRQFSGFRRDRMAMARWIAAFQPDIVVMERTGIYWKSFWNGKASAHGW